MLIKSIFSQLVGKSFDNNDINSEKIVRIAVFSVQQAATLCTSQEAESFLELNLVCWGDN